MLSWTKVWVTLAAVFVLLVPISAHAQRAATIQVVALDSDDASEDQADALTAALRTQVRNSPTFRLIESNQSLSTLLPALKCPTRPDSACLERIGDQLKTDRFIWGYVVKAGVPHQVTAEVHLWTRGAPEQIAKETYSNNLKDQNDDALRRIAASLYGRLTGQQTQGTIVVNAAGTQTGTVLVDGKPMGQLDHGQATLLIGSGEHTVEVEAAGLNAPAQTVNVAVNTSTNVSFTLKAAAVTGSTPSGPSHTKRMIGFISVGVAGAAVITAAIMGGLYAGDSSTFNDFRAKIPTTEQTICSNPSLATQNTVGWSDACSARSKAGTEGSVAWALGGAAVGLGTLGVILIMTDHGKEEGAPPPATSLRVLPSFGPTGASVTALLTF